MEGIKNFTQAEINRLRPTMEAFGKLYGRALIAPLCDNLDIDHNKKVKDGVNPRLNEPVQKYFTKVVTMWSFRLGKDANEKAVIIINDDPNLTFPLIGNEQPKIKECTPDKVNDAIRKYRDNKHLTFFTDVEAVTTIVTTLNENNSNTLIAFAEDLMHLSQSLLDLNKSEKANLKDYMDSIKI